MIVGSKYLVRAACVLGVLLGTSAARTAAAGDNDQLFQRRPDRLLIESARRVSDGRKLQKDADTNFRRAEGGAVVTGGDGERAAAERGAEGSSEPGAASPAGSAASADRR